MPYKSASAEAAYRRNRRSIQAANRRFVGWDGEGYSAWVVDSNGVCYGKRHFYLLFGSTDGIVRTSHNLSTRECLTAILDGIQAGVINIAFAFDYDVNMILKDIGRRSLLRLKENGFTWWYGFRIEHRPHKWFQVSVKGADGERKVLRIYDIFSFFGCSFVEACKSYLGKSESLDKIAQGKARRAEFGYLDLQNEILPYWTLEGEFLVLLAEKLRIAINSAGIQISHWHGPGAVATALFKRYKVKSFMDREVPKEVAEASRYAYSSGRFEPFRGGYYLGEIQIADINSAYPYALSRLPRLDNGYWEYLDSDKAIETLLKSQRMGVYRIEYVGKDRLQPSMRGWPMPLFYRDPNNRIHYPCIVSGWYFAPEAWAALQFDSGNTTIREAWVYRDDGSYPFEWVNELFYERRKLKAQGNPGERGIKLGLNSAYGKMAQRVGWDQERREAPTYHQLEWAGTITATCRAMLYAAMLPVAQKGGLVSCDTDGIISTVRFDKLPNGIGDGLGEWEISEYTGILYLQNGVYWLRNKDGDWLPPKSRGIPREQLAFDKGLRNYRLGLPTVAQQHQFVGYSTALRGRYDRWRTWYDHEKVFEFGGKGKRAHSPHFCSHCRHGGGFERDGLHNLILTNPGGGESSPHYLPWMDDVEEDEESPFLVKRNTIVADI